MCFHDSGWAGWVRRMCDWSGLAGNRPSSLAKGACLGICFRRVRGCCLCRLLRRGSGLSMGALMFAVSGLCGPTGRGFGAIRPVAVALLCVLCRLLHVVICAVAECLACSPWLVPQAAFVCVCDHSNVRSCEGSNGLLDTERCSSTPLHSRGRRCQTPQDPPRGPASALVCTRLAGTRAGRVGATSQSVRGVATSKRRDTKLVT